MAYGEFVWEVGALVWFKGSRRVHTIRWRGWLLVPIPGTRSVRRHDVYRVEGGIECYYADELVPAWSGNPGMPSWYG